MITPEGTLHFPHLYNPEEYMGKTKYGCRIVFDEGVTPGTGLNDLADAIVAAAHKEWGDNPPSSFLDKFPLKEVEGEDDRFYFNARRKEDIGRPGIIDGAGQPINDVDRMYPGCRVRLAIKIHAYDYGAGAQGVTLLLEAVQRLGDGEPILQDPNARAATLFGSSGGGAAPAPTTKPSSGNGATGTYQGLFGKGNA